MTGSTPGAPELVEVRIVAMPLDAYREASEHGDELLREFALIRDSDNDAGSRAIPRRLHDLVDSLTGDYGAFTGAQEHALRAALDRGDEAIDLAYRVPAQVKDACTALSDMLDEADDFCRHGTDLLTLATPPRALAFRRWFLGEFIRQVDGKEPTRWQEPPA